MVNNETETEIIYFFVNNCQILRDYFIYRNLVYKFIKYEY